MSLSLLSEYFPGVLRALPPNRVLCFYRVFMGFICSAHAWVGRYLRTRKKGVLGGGGSTRIGMWCLHSPVPICSRRKWLTSLGCLTGALGDKTSDKALNTL